MSDYLRQLGILGFGTRFRRVSERIMANADLVYKSLGISFEARWFATFYLLYSSSEPQSVTDISSALGLSHPAVIQITSAMLTEGIIESYQDKKDARKRLIKLSTKGKELLPLLEPVWDDFARATQQLFEEIDTDMISILDKLESAFDKAELNERIASLIKNSQYEAVEIIEYQAAYKESFKDLNYEWLNKYFEVEEKDEIILNNPEKEILEKGGKIFFARTSGKIVGTLALNKLDDNTYLISKMAVNEQYQRKQIGLKLTKTAIQTAKQLNGKCILLITDKKLTAAVQLYRKLGFAITKAEENLINDYQRAKTGFVMKLELN